MIKQYETPQTMRSGSLVHYYIVSHYIRMDSTSDISLRLEIFKQYNNYEESISGNGAMITFHI